MSVELSKHIDGETVQRVRFTIIPAEAGQRQVEIVIHHDEERYDQQQLHTVSSREEALSVVYRELAPALVGLLKDQVVTEHDLGEATWELTAHPAAPKDDLELAGMIMGRVDDWLADILEERDIEEMVEAGEPIRWGITDYETGEFEHTYTEYPSSPTKLVYPDGRVEYVDADGLVVDEDGNAPDTEA